MSANNEDRSETLSDGMKITAEAVGFAADKLAECSGCKRLNAPTRGECMYCGAALDLRPDVQAQQGDPFAEKPAPWEIGFNVVMPAVPSNLEAGLVMEGIFGEHHEVCTGSLASGSAVPIARTTSAAAQHFINNSGNEGAAIVVSDSELASTDPPQRIRSLRFNDTEVVFVDFNTGSEVSLKFEDLRLAVLGDVVETTIESVEKLSRSRRHEPEELRADVDRPVLDIYSAGDRIGRRIQVGGFDFSVLREEKSLIAAENLTKLIEVLQFRTPSCRYDSNYARLKNHLNAIWELDAETDPFARSIRVLNRKEKSRVIKRSNATQFLKYSRLQAYFL